MIDSNDSTCDYFNALNFKFGQNVELRKYFWVN